MYQVHLRGTKKGVYLVRSSILGYGEPEILYEAGTDDLYVMHCEVSTKYDAIPNQHSFSDPPEKWDGHVVDLSTTSMEGILAGNYYLSYSNYELDVLSGMFGVDIEILNDPDDKWWEDADYDEDFDEDYEDEEFEDNEEEFEGGPRPQYPFYAYSNGKEVRDDTLESFDLDVFSF